MLPLQKNILATCIAVSLSSAFYTLIWLSPGTFRRFAGASNSVRVMALSAHFLKLVQFGLIAASPISPAAALLSALRSCPADARPCALFVGCVLLFAFGQTLNTRVYYLLGEGGVYYGNILEPHVKRPWVREWPYNSVWIRHPQYLGSTLSLLAVAGVGMVHPTVALCWAGNYLYLALLESDLLCARSSMPEKKAAK
jgi:methylene-fatty-acyl-phospholipid synthase